TGATASIMRVRAGCQAPLDTVALSPDRRRFAIAKMPPTWCASVEARMERARYRQIYAHLRRQILSGVYRVGDKLPTEMEVAALHGVSRVTSAAALTALAREGLVQRTPGRGTVVLPGLRHDRAKAPPLIAWIQPDLDPSFGLNLLRGVEQ